MMAAIRTWAADARAWQQAALADLSALDEACRCHMAHSAMSGSDPLTDSMLQQLDCSAEEGARPATPYTDGIQPQPESRAWWLASAILLVALAGVVVLGAAS